MKFLSVLIALIMAFSLTACTSEPSDEPQDPAEATQDGENIEDGGDSSDTYDESMADINEMVELYLEDGYSYDGLVEVLEYTFTHDEAVEAVDNCGADWNEQAVLAAHNTLEYTAYSYDGLYYMLM